MNTPGRRAAPPTRIGPATRLFRATALRDLTHANAALTSWYQAQYAGAPPGPGSHPPSPAAALQDLIRRNATLQAEWEADAARALVAWLTDTAAAPPAASPALVEDGTNRQA